MQSIHLSSDTIVLSAIRGSDFNGGEIPDLDNEALQLWYYDSSNRAWRPLNQNPLGATDNTVNHIIIPNVPGEGSIPPEDKILRDWTLNSSKLGKRVRDEIHVLSI